MKILIIRVSAIGDVIHTLPALFLLKATNPHVQISWVVQKKAAHLLEGQPFLKNVWVLADRFLMPQHLSQTLTMLKEIRSHQWDAIIDFQGLLKTSILLMALRGKKYGFDWQNAREPASSLFTRHHATPVYSNIIQKNLALASEVMHDLMGARSCPTIDTIKQSLYLHIPDNKKKTVSEWITVNNLTKIIALCPNTTWQSKRWPIDHWLKLLTMIPSDYSVVLIGKDFGNDAATIASLAEKAPGHLSILPRWDLLTTTYFIQQAGLLIAPDTSFLHIADILGTPAISLFGPTSRQIHGPFLHPKNHAHALQAACPHRYKKTHGPANKNQSLDCMENISPSMVLEHINDILSGNNDKHNFPQSR